MRRRRKDRRPDTVDVNLSRVRLPRVRADEIVLEALLTREEVALLLRCHTSTVDRLADAELLRRVYVGRTPLFDPAEIRRFIDEGGAR
jgi:hypothetical protein